MFPLTYLKQYSENYLQSGGLKDFSTYYTANYSLAKFDESLNSKMIFSTHNLVSDHSFNEFQLILCRNVLIYFDKELQHKVFNLFDGSIEKLGYLALGSKESLEFWPKAKEYKRVKWKNMAETVDSTACSALVIGGSAGSLDVLLEIFPALRKDIHFPIIIVVHRKASNESLLTDLLKSRTTLAVAEADEKEF